MTETTKTKSGKALDYKSGTIFFVPPEDLVIVGVDNTSTEGLLDLTVVHDRAPDEELILSIMVKGVEQVLTVTKNGTENGKPRIEVVAGRRRTLAARIANQRLKKEGKPPIEVPCRVVKDDIGTLLGIQATENMIRKNLGILDQAELLAQLIKVRKPELAMIDMGIKSRVTMYKYLKLNELSPEIKAAIREEKISATAALMLVDLKREDQLPKLKELLTQGASTAQQIQDKIKAEKAVSTGAEPAYRKPSTSELRKILAAVAEDKIALDPVVYKTIQVILGDISPARNVPTLHAALKLLREER